MIEDVVKAMGSADQREGKMAEFTRKVEKLEEERASSVERVKTEARERYPEELNSEKRLEAFAEYVVETHFIEKYHDLCREVGVHPSDLPDYVGDTKGEKEDWMNARSDFYRGETQSQESVDEEMTVTGDRRSAILEEMEGWFKETISN